MYSKMLNQKMFMKWLMDFKHREFVKDKSNEFAFYEIYKAIYEQAVSDTEERLRYEYEVEREDIESEAYRDGERYGYEVGWDEGYEEGRMDGYKEGYDAGCEESLK